MEKIKQKKTNQLVNSLESTKKQKYRNVPTPRPSEIIKKETNIHFKRIETKKIIYIWTFWLAAWGTRSNYRLNKTK